MPSDRRWLRHTQASVEALRIFSFLDNDVTQDVVIQREGKKVERWRVYAEGRPK